MGEAIQALRAKMDPIPEGRYLIGLSGGADSVALLTALLPDMRGKRIHAEAVHVNHGLRGAEADGDERFCGELCRREGVAMKAFRVDLAGRTDEAAARDARYGIFRNEYAAYGADGLILAHHADDQAETFLMRLLRGAGPDGLACMKADEQSGGLHILRPMLGLRRDEIREALQADGISWREDASNEDTAYLRNRIRRELMPEMERITGSAVEKISRAAMALGEDNRLLNDLSRDILGRIADGKRLDAAALAGEPAALRRRALRIWWTEEGPKLPEHALSAEQTAALDRLLDERKGKINLPGGTHAVRNGKYLFLTHEGEAEAAPVAVSGTKTVFGDYVLTVTASEGNPGDGKRTQEVPEGFIRDCVIRTRQAGDRIRPFGSGGSKKLQDYLTDRKIPEPFRDQIPLLCRKQEVLLVCGVGAGDIPKWTPEAVSVRLTWHGKMPWSE